MHATLESRKAVAFDVITNSAGIRHCGQDECESSGAMTEACVQRSSPGFMQQCTCHTGWAHSLGPGSEATGRDAANVDTVYGQLPWVKRQPAPYVEEQKSKHMIVHVTCHMNVSVKMSVHVAWDVHATQVLPLCCVCYNCRSLRTLVLPIA